MCVLLGLYNDTYIQLSITFIQESNVYSSQLNGIVQTGKECIPITITNRFTNQFTNQFTKQFTLSFINCVPMYSKCSLEYSLVRRRRSNSNSYALCPLLARYKGPINARHTRKCQGNRTDFRYIYTHNICENINTVSYRKNALIIQTSTFYCKLPIEEFLLTKLLLNYY